MALAKEVTDNKGVPATYHRISSFKFEHGSLQVTVLSYISEAQRQREKDIVTENDEFEAFQIETNQLQQELDQKSLLLATMPISSDPTRAALEAEVIALSNQFNDRLSGERPEMQFKENLSCSTDIIEIPFGPDTEISLTNLYAELKTLDRYKDADFA